ncbi:MAG: lysophospholipid acyltransferase family protein [Lentisphaerales bacterium]|nr:lysophospholipid acyltransferase family protein [Lentisphaerales bacterium]
MSGLKQARKRLFWRLEAGVALTFFFFIRFLPFSGMRFFGKLFGSILFMLPSQKKLVLANIKTAFPDMPKSEAMRIGRTSLQGMLLVFCEMMWFYGDAEKISKYITIPENIRDRIRELNHNGRSTLFLPMHWGNWEISTFALKQIDATRPVTVIAKKQKNPILDDHVMDGRRKVGFNFVRAKGAAKALLKALRNKESVGLLVDQNTKTHKGGTFGNFFGLPVTISKTAATMAYKFNTNVYVFACRRTENGFEVYIKELPKEPKEYSNQQELSQGMLDIMEQVVRDYPDQWIWLYERWNYIPKNMSDLKQKYPFYAIVDQEEYHLENT